MADNPYRSYRGRDQVAHNGDPSPLRAPADPLAELARLIGQNDPRNQFDHDQAPAPGPAASEAWPPEEPYEASGQAAEPAYDQGYDENYDERYDPPRLAEPAAPYGAGPPSRSRDYPPPARTHDTGDEPRFYAPVEPRHPAERQAPAGYGQSLPTFAAQRDDYDYDDRDQGVPAYAEDEEAAAGRRRRVGPIVVAAVLGVAVLGTAGAFAYRAMFGGSMVLSLPPIIKADTGPNKIVPNAASGQNGASTQAKAGAYGEKVVSREEQPVDVPAPVSTAPRVVSTIPIFPAPSAPAGAWAAGVTGAAPPPGSSTLEPAAPAQMTSPMPAASAQAMPPPGTAPMTHASAVVSTEPKKIHTVAIRSDQSGAADPAAPAAPAAATAAPAPRPVAAAKPVMPQPARPPAAATAGNTPLSIVPGQGDTTPPVRTRTASLMQTPLPGPAAGSAPAGSAATGGYAVQITSQRSEAEAQAAFRSLAAKYPAQLGGHQPIVRQADLGSKGIFYRALVGPFASMEQAAGLCSSLKAAGGACIVQRN